MNERITGAALIAAQIAYESARRSGLRGVDLLPMGERLRAAEAAHIEAARAANCWHTKAPPAVKVRAAVRPAPAA